MAERKAGSSPRSGPRSGSRPGPRPRAGAAAGAPEVTVAVLNYNGRRHLEECLDTLAAQDFPRPFEVLVWDNASSDGSAALARGRPGVRVIESPDNLGFAGAMNRAVAAARAGRVVLLNNDVRLPPDWLSRLVECAGACPDAPIVGCRLLLYERPDRVNHAGGLFAPIGGGWDEGFGLPEARFAGRPRWHETGIASGGAMLVDRRRFQQLGGFDDRFFMYFEDVDLCLRAWQAGFRVVHAAEAKVFHKFGGASGGFSSPLRAYWGQRNRMRILWRSYPAARLAWALALLVPWTAAGILLALRQKGAASAWLRATRDGLRDRKDYRAGFASRRAAAKRAARHLRRAGHWGGVVQAFRAAVQARRGFR